MAETFFGMKRALDYNEPGDVDNSCLAVDLAMLGVDNMQTIHDALVVAGISTEGGWSSIGQEPISLDLDGNKIHIDTARNFFKLEDLEADSRQQFDRGEAAIVGVELHEDDPDNFDMHLILLAGHYREGENVTQVVVGDSLLDGIQQQTPEVLYTRLGRTLDSQGALFSCHVTVEYMALVTE